MNERFLTTFYPKIKKSSITQKFQTISKLDSTGKKNITKIDYFDVLSQIKMKKKYLEKATLFHNFVFNNNIQRQNILRQKLINQNTQTALITETTYDKKNISNKRISENTDSLIYPKFMRRRRIETPKRKKLINRIIKFEEENKEIKKIKLSKKKTPIELRSNYKELVEKIKHFNFVNKYSNCNTDYAHNIRSKYYIDSVNESLKLEKKRNDKYLKKEKEKMELEKELRDKVFYPSLELQKISKQIKFILGNKNKFNQVGKREKFFDKFENRINFIYDNFKPPNIKNNLVKIILEDIKEDKKLNLINRIGNSALNYLSNIKVKFQREKDDKIKFLIEKNKIKKKYGYYKKLSSIFIYNSKEEIEKIIYKNYYLKNDGDEIISENKNMTFEEFFENKNYFEDKYEKFENVCICEPKLRNFFFDNLNFTINDNHNSKILNL